MLLAALALGLVGCGSTGSDAGGPGVEAPTGADLVRAYCAYGAVSRAQLQSCPGRVTPATVRGYSTNAARYAEGKISACLADSGPYCHPR
jgi:hypothetical protein